MEEEGNGKSEDERVEEVGLSGERPLTSRQRPHLQYWIGSDRIGLDTSQPHS